MNRRKFLKTFGTLCLVSSVSPSLVFAKNKLDIEKLKRYLSKKFENYPDFKDKKYLTTIFGPSQELYLFKNKNGDLITHKIYGVSTSKYGFGNKIESLKTPIGVHKINKKIGDGLSIGVIFDHLVGPNPLYDKFGNIKPLMTTRLLRLEGVEEENKNSFNRNICMLELI